MDWNLAVSLFAALTSVAALVISYTYSRKNVRLSIFQSVIRSISEKAKDCNGLWELDSKPGLPNHKLVSELVISRELIDKSLILFHGNEKRARQDKDEFYYLFAKQLRTDIRNFVMNAAEKHKEQGEIYCQQIEGIKEAFSKHF